MTTTTETAAAYGPDLDARVAAWGAMPMPEQDAPEDEISAHEDALRAAHASARAALDAPAQGLDDLRVKARALFFEAARVEGGALVMDGGLFQDEEAVAQLGTLLDDIERVCAARAA